MVEVFYAKISEPYFILFVQSNNNMQKRNNMNEAESLPYPS